MWQSWQIQGTPPLFPGGRKGGSRFFEKETGFFFEKQEKERKGEIKLERVFFFFFLRVRIPHVVYGSRPKLSPPSAGRSFLSRMLGQKSSVPPRS